MWIDAADKFYLVDNKKAKLGPLVLKNVWKICREVPKWKIYNEDLRNVRKRKSYHIEGEVVPLNFFEFMNFFRTSCSIC